MSTILDLLIFGPSSYFGLICLDRMASAPPGKKTVFGIALLLTALVLASVHVLLRESGLLPGASEGLAGEILVRAGSAMVAGCFLIGLVLAVSGVWQKRARRNAHRK